MQQNTKRFELSDVKRIPVEITPQAVSFLSASHHQGRLASHALSEHFGALGTVEKIMIDIQPKRTYFPTDNSEDQVIIVTAIAQSGARKTWVVNANSFTELHPKTHLPNFSAKAFAEELVRLYNQGG